MKYGRNTVLPNGRNTIKKSGRLRSGSYDMGLSLYKSIEKAFDYEKLCFLYDLLSGALHVKILCNDLKETFIFDDKIRMQVNDLRTDNDIDHAFEFTP
jgi:hypothetical protein